MTKFNVLTIPDSVNDMTIEHLPFFMALSELAPEGEEVSDTILLDLEPHEVSDLVGLFFNAKPGAFDIYDSNSNLKMLMEIVLSCSKYDEKPIPKSYTIDGVEYIWQEDYSKQPVSFHRDIGKCDFTENPLELVAFCYIEKGMIYNQPHPKTKAVLNPRKDRAEKFRKEISLAAYLDLNGFFLMSYDVFKPYLKVKEERRARMKNAGTGKSQSTT